MLEKFNKKIYEKQDELNDWLSKIYKDAEMPIYGSLDIRF